MASADLLSDSRIPLVFLAVLIVVSNTTVCVLVCVNHEMRTFTNGFVVSLALSDILIGGVLLPIIVTMNNSLVQEYVCSIALLSGVFNICAVTYDRYVAITRPFRYHSIMRKRFPAIVAVSWCLALAISFLPLLWDTDSDKVVHKVYVFCVEIICVLVPHMFVFAGHYKIFKEVRRFVQIEKKLTYSFWKNNNNDKQCRVSSEAKVAKVFIVITITFALSWFPVEYMTTVYELGRPDLIPTSLRIISLFTIALGSLVNPIVYSFMKPDFRHAFRKILQGKRFGNSEGWSSRKKRNKGSSPTARPTQKETIV